MNRKSSVKATNENIANRLNEIELPKLDELAPIIADWMNHGGLMIVWNGKDRCMGLWRACKFEQLNTVNILKLIEPHKD